MQTSLQTISTEFPDDQIRMLAEELAVCIATLGAIRPPKDIHGTQERGKDWRLQATLEQLKDPLIPVRGHALIALTQLINSKDEEAMRNTTTLLRVFKENLCHSDSYLYLAAINGLVALALASPSTSETVLTTLCQEYASLSGRPNPTARSKYDKATGMLRARENETSARSSKPLDIETRMKLGEALVRVCKELQALLPHYLEDVVASLLTAVKDPEPLIRASSLSNLAQVCSVGQVVLTSVATEVSTHVPQHKMLLSNH